MLLQRVCARNRHQSQFTISAAEMMCLFASALVVSFLPVIGDPVDEGFCDR